jgi:hypothetical protein
LDLKTVLLGDLKDHSQSIGNVIVLLGTFFILGAISAEMLQIGRFKSFVRHQWRMEYGKRKWKNDDLLGKIG